MGRACRNVAVLVLLNLLIPVACSPFNNGSPAITPSVSVVPSNDTEIITIEQTSTVSPPAVVSSPTVPVDIPPATLLPPSDLYVFIQAPEGPVEAPFVTLLAFQSVPDVSIEIKGTLDARGFICEGSPCSVPVPTSSVIIFRASSSTGATSDEIYATVRVELRTDGYYVFLDTLSQFSPFSDSCLRFWRFQNDTNPAWADFVQFPYQINTDKTLHYLVTRLILNGVVDVNGCPAGGLSIGLDWPTGCGLERARDTMTAWQNQYDEYIWLASKDYGIPPKILKTLIEVESQFWPGNERYYLDEIGLGQLNQLGVDVLLRRNPTLYQQVCSAVLDDCAMPYSLMSPQNQAMIRGAYVNSFSSLCPGCQYGLDLNKAKQSIPFIAQVLHANCETVKVITDSRRESDYIEDMEDPYSSFWRFTLLAYHSGVSCFEQAIKGTPNGLSLDWENVAENIECAGGRDYVDGVWGNLLSFDQYLYSSTRREIGQVTPVFAATPTPFPTAVRSSAQTVVQAFLDSNQNGIADEGEGLENITVLLQSVDGTEVSGITENGQVTLPLAEFQIDSEVTVSLPGYFRTQKIIVPAQGMVSVMFIFSQPTLPTVIP
jgi:hypothetical protein